MSALPDLPTVAEAGVAGFAVSQWYAMLAPAGTPPALIARLNREINQALRDPDTARRITAEGSDPVGSTSRQLATLMQSERDKWAKVIRAAGIRGE